MAIGIMRLHNKISPLAQCKSVLSVQKLHSGKGILLTLAGQPQMMY